MAVMDLVLEKCSVAPDANVSVPLPSLLRATLEMRSSDPTAEDGAGTAVPYSMISVTAVLSTSSTKWPGNLLAAGPDDLINGGALTVDARLGHPLRPLGQIRIATRTDS